MKLHSENHTLESSGITETNSFTIKNSIAAFQILSSKLYSNKPLAIIRELSTNAYDSHVKAGKKNVPFEIRLPNRMDPTFCVKDYGTGLSHEEVMKLYTTYFESTKADSNEFVGALGLGSKTPFSYTSSFVVESRYNGVQRTYTAYINSNGMPTISLINEVETTEENGLTITLSIKDEDFNRFVSEAQSALMYFDPAPVVVGVQNFKPHELTYSMSGTSWKLRETTDRSKHGAYIIQGFIAYPIDESLLAQHGNLSNHAETLLGVNLDITVPIGEVDFAVSREALEYTPITTQNIITHLEQMANEMHASIQKKVDAEPTYWAACVACNTAFESNDQQFIRLFKDLQSLKSFTWSGKEVTGSVSLNKKNLTTTVLETLKVSYSKRHSFYFNRMIKKSYTLSNTVVGSFDANGDYHILVKKNSVLFINDTGKTSYLDTVRSYLYKENNGGSMLDYDIKLLVIAPAAKGKINEKEVAAIIEELGNPNIVRISTLPKPTLTTKTGQKRRTKTSRLRWIGFHRRDTFSRQCWQAEEIDFANGGFYVPIEHLSIVHENHYVYKFDYILEKMEELKLVKPSIKIYGFTVKEMATISGNKNWVNFLTKIEEGVVKLQKDKALEAEMTAQVMMSDYISYNFQMLFLRDNGIIQKLSPCGFRDYLIKFRQMRSMAKKSKRAKSAVGFFNAAFSFSKVDISERASNKAKALHNEFQKEKNKYELLEVIQWDYIKKVEPVINYINMVNKQ